MFNLKQLSIFYLKDINFSLYFTIHSTLYKDFVYLSLTWLLFLSLCVLMQQQCSDIPALSVLLTEFKEEEIQIYSAHNIFLILYTDFIHRVYTNMGTVI